jgi:hypothetical protein
MQNLSPLPSLEVPTKLQHRLRSFYYLQNEKSLSTKNHVYTHVIIPRKLTVLRAA